MPETAVMPTQPLNALGGIAVISAGTWKVPLPSHVQPLQVPLPAHDDGQKLSGAHGDGGGADGGVGGPGGDTGGAGGAGGADGDEAWVP